MGRKKKIDPSSKSLNDTKIKQKTTNTNIDRDFIFSKLFSHLSTQKREDLIRPIIPVKEWVKDPYYVGQQGLALYPFWIKVIDDVFKGDGELRYNICIAGGGLGTGKSTAGVYLMVRFLYELSCYDNIHKHLGLRMDTSALVLLLFCITKKQVKNTTFRKLRETIDAIPYFQDNFPRYERANDELRFPKNVLVLYGSGTGDALGLDLACSLLDEANFFSDASGNSTDMSEVSDLHRSLIARQQSRFMSNGKNRSLSIVVSSSTYSSGYTEELKRRSLTDPTIKYYRARVWDVRPKGTYSDEKFYVFCGNDKTDPFIINDVMDLTAKLNIRVNPSMSIPDAVAQLPNDLRVLVDDVPIDFRKQYDVNLLKSIQDVSGFSIQSSGGLFNNRTIFDACIDYTIPTLFTKNEFVIETQNDSPQNSIMYYLSGIPFLHPECPRFIHVDLSLSTDTTGISCFYKFGEKEVDGVKRPIYYYDFCLRILPPPPPKKISIARVEEFIIYMRDKPIKWGFKMYVICDSINGFCLNIIPHIGDKKFEVKEIVINLSKNLRTNDFLYMDRYYCSIYLFIYLYKKGIRTTGTILAKRKNMPKKF